LNWLAFGGKCTKNCPHAHSYECLQTILLGVARSN
jgi:hypothetical protein